MGLRCMSQILRIKTCSFKCKQWSQQQRARTKRARRAGATGVAEGEGEGAAEGGAEGEVGAEEAGAGEEGDEALVPALVRHSKSLPQPPPRLPLLPRQMGTGCPRHGACA